MSEVTWLCVCAATGAVGLCVGFAVGWTVGHEEGVDDGLREAAHGKERRWAI